jgi:hypothetical protein
MEVGEHRKQRFGLRRGRVLHAGRDLAVLAAVEQFRVGQVAKSGRQRVRGDVEGRFEVAEPERFLGERELAQNRHRVCFPEKGEQRRGRPLDPFALRSIERVPEGDGVLARGDTERLRLVGWLVHALLDPHVPGHFGFLYCAPARLSGPILRSYEVTSIRLPTP